MLLRFCLAGLTPTGGCKKKATYEERLYIKGVHVKGCTNKKKRKIDNKLILNTNK